jgi:glyoxylase-like metal-dependent hydrolase (beta-lactamase superfamily II)
VLTRSVLFSLMWACVAAASVLTDVWPCYAQTVAINVFNEPGPGSVNSYWLATPAGVVVIDAQRTLSSAENLARQIKATGKPVLGIIITHPHPDHARGLVVLAKEFPDAAIYSSQATLDSMKADKFHYFPSDLPMPNKIIEPNGDLVVGGIKFKTNEIGAGEAEAMTVLYLPIEKIVFSSDVISGHRMTPYLAEGRSGAWLKQLEAISPECLKMKTVYPGHGAAGPPRELIAAQKKYIVTLRGLIRKQLRSGMLSPENKQAIVSEMERRYPNSTPVAFVPQTIETSRQLLGLNVDAMAKELTQEPH